MDAKIMQEKTCICESTQVVRSRFQVQGCERKENYSA